MRPEPDVETSSDDYAQRFSGPVGHFLLETQARATLDLLRPWPGTRVLDLGGGHGQLTGPLVDAGHDVTVYGSSPGCARRVRPWTGRGLARFVSGELLRTPFRDRAFDIAISYRLLPHLAAWRELVVELCRVAGRAVLVDYPTSRSVNAAAGALFGAKQRVEGNARPFAVFRDAEVEAAFTAAGFEPTGRRPQFLMPMALHRALGSGGLSRVLESGAGALGLTRLLGSPVILRAERG